MTDNQHLEGQVLEMDLSQKIVDSLAERFQELCSFSQALASVILGCDWQEVTPEQILVVENALQRRVWGGPNE